MLLEGRVLTTSHIKKKKKELWETLDQREGLGVLLFGTLYFGRQDTGAEFAILSHMNSLLSGMQFNLLLDFIINCHINIFSSNSHKNLKG